MKRSVKPPRPTKRTKRKPFKFVLSDQRVFALLMEAVGGVWADKLISESSYLAICEVCATKDVVKLLTQVIPSFEAAVARLKTLEEVRAHLAIVSLVKKFPFANGYGEKEREEAAYKTWLYCEASCLTTNRKFVLARQGRDYSQFDPRTLRILERASRMIEECITSLGDADDMVRFSLRNGRFGPGMTLCSENAMETSAYHKYSTLRYSCTASATPYFMAAISGNQRWMRLLIRRDLKNPKRGLLSGAAMEYSYLKRSISTVRASRLTFVDKNALTKRPITIGALGNVYVQLGVDLWIKKCIKTYFKIDITDNQLNRYLAYKGSVDGTTATVDSRSASDMICYQLVQYLMRYCSQQFAFLSDLRETSTSYGEVEHALSKFSGMGNGYTFALESLIFAALTAASALECGDKSSIAIHGDDIACGTATAKLLLAVFPDIGLEVNVDKTYISGPFREACGYDFWNGHNVRQYTLDTRQFNETSLISLYNGIMCTAMRNTIDADCKPWLMNGQLQEIIHKLPRCFVGPAASGNMCSSETYGESRYLVLPASPKIYGLDLPRYVAQNKSYRFNRDASAHLRWLLTLRDGKEYHVLHRGVTHVTHRRAPKYHWSTPSAVWSEAFRNVSDFFALGIYTHYEERTSSVDQLVKTPKRRKP